MVILLINIAISACSYEGAQDHQQSTSGSFTSETSSAPKVDTPASIVIQLARQLEICKTPEPQIPSSAFIIEKGEPIKRGSYWMEDYWVTYQCKEVCTDWQRCTVPAHMDDNEEVITHTRNPETSKQALAFVVDNMGGHIVFNVDESVNDSTLIIHTGGGGTNNYPITMVNSLEDHADVHTVMVRWEDGFIMRNIHNLEDIADRWGWLTRDSEEPASIRENNRRVASLFAWIHENLAGPDKMGTVGCSMAGQATLGTVIWHGLDEIIDYQLATGGPPIWDANAGCARQNYDHGYCVLDGVTRCKTDDDCERASAKGMCLYPGTVNRDFDWYYEGVINHIHATTRCDISEVDKNTEPYQPFDNSGFVGATDGDWQFDHMVDLGADVGIQGTSDWGGMDDARDTGTGGDEHWMAGHYMYVFNNIQPAENRQWHAFTDSIHCKTLNEGKLTELIAFRMELEKRQ